MAAFLAPFLVSLAASVVLGIAAQLIRGAPRGPKPLVQDEFKVPTTEDGREIPWIFGRVVCAGPNVLHYRLRGSQRIRRRSGLFSRTTVGRRYDFALHFGICMEPETLHAVRWGGKDVIVGGFTEDPYSRVRLPDLFGGDSGEGGLDGRLQVLFGAPDQVLDLAAAEEFTEGNNFRGFMSLYWRGVCTTTPYIKPLEAEVSRYTAGWESGSAWYPETAYVPLNEAAEGEGQEFSFIFIASSSSRMNGAIVTGSSTTRIQTSRGIISLAFDKLIELKNRYGSAIKINAVVAIWDSSSAVFSAINASAAALDSLRDTYVSLGTSGNYFYTAANGAIAGANFALDAAGVTGARTMFFVTAGADTPSFIDGIPPFGTADSRTQFLIDETADLSARTGAFAPGTGRTTTVYRARLGNLSDNLPITTLNNGVASTLPIYSPSSTRFADLIDAQIADEYVGPYFGANPAHIIYELISTARPRGMGYATSAIDADSFTDAADVFYDERLGLCVKWEFSGSLRELIEGVATHAGCIVRQSNTTGLWQIVPLRKDYTVGSLPLFDESNIVRVSTFERAGGGEQITSITGKYRDVFVREDRVTPASRNLALIQQQEADIGEQRDYVYAPTETICARLVDRDLQIAGLPLALIEIEVNRTAYNVQEGDVVRVADARIGVNPIVMRVLAVDEGDLNDGTIVLRGNEDQFGLADFVATAPQPIDFEPPDERPLPSTQFAAFELPFQIINEPGGPSSVANLIGYVGVMAAPPENLLTDFDLYSSTDPEALVQDAEGQFVPAGVLSAALLQTDSALVLTDTVNIDDVQVGDFAVIGTGDDAEWARVIEIGSEINVERGLLDTTPTLTPWPIGTPVWFAQGTEAAGETPYTDGDEVTVAISSRSPQGVLDPEISPQETITLANRASRPYVPGNVLINTEAYPVTITGALSITWSERNRLTQPANVLQTNATDYTAEAGTTYNVWAYDVTTETLLASDTGLTIAEWEPGLPDAYPLRIEIEAERDGLVSWQRQKRQFVYVSATLEARSIDTTDDESREDDVGNVRLIN